ncbi:MAG: hypothetical protein QOE79_338 [Sphingomonadales bacterium]|nr:hypothetical protein [Sphingomonadales bacterium]MEA3049066.1 hypothetical protein [Sphingomonadales bacterium]
MTYLAAALFFTFALLAAAVAIHMTVRAYWAEIRLALRGELGRPVAYRIAPVRRDARAPAYAAVRPRQRAAA